MSRCPECKRLGFKAGEARTYSTAYLCTNDDCRVDHYHGRAVLQRKGAQPVPFAMHAAMGEMVATPGE
jgi:hypothetical protein